MIRLIACDLDETLLNGDKQICERNRKAIARAIDEFHVYFVPATGRGYTGVTSVLETLQVKDKENEYIISNNGGIISENANHRILSMHALDFPTVEALCGFGFQKDICIQIFTAEDVYAYHLNEDERSWLFMFKPDSIVCEGEDITILKDKKITKILFQSTDMEYLRKIADEMEFITDNRVTVSYSSGRYLELNAMGVDKGTGLKELADFLHIDMKETMAIGDNYNDLKMLEVAGVSIAVANAYDDIKQVCDYVTVADHNQGAVAEAIEKFIFEGK